MKQLVNILLLGIAMQCGAQGGAERHAGYSESIAQSGFHRIVKQGGVFVTLDANCELGDARVLTEPENLLVRPLLVMSLEGDEIVVHRQRYFTDAVTNNSVLWWDWNGKIWLYFTKHYFNQIYTFSMSIREASLQDGEIAFGRGLMKESNVGDLCIVPPWGASDMVSATDNGYPNKHNLGQNLYWSAFLDAEGNVFQAVIEDDGREDAMYVHQRLPNGKLGGASYNVKYTSPFSLIIQKGRYFLLYGDGRIKELDQEAADGEKQIANLRSLPNWRADKGETCYYIVDKDADRVHFLWGETGYALFDGVRLTSGKMPGDIGKMYETLQTEFRRSARALQEDIERKKVPGDAK